MKEPMRYIDNAKEILRKSPIEDNQYVDVKYVKSACGVAYLGVLKAIDEYLLKQGLLDKQLPEKVEEYQKTLKKYGGIHNGKLLRQFNTIYHELHIAGYYKGHLRYTKTVKDALQNAVDFINKFKYCSVRIDRDTEPV